MVTQGLHQACLLLGRQAVQNPAWVEYGEYCLNREKGLRKQAFVHLNTFLTQAGCWDFEQKEEFVLWLCRTMATVPYGDHWPFPTPLAKGLISPVIDECIKREPTDAELFVLKARYTGDLEAYDMAISLDPNNQAARFALAEECIYDIWFATHHLPEYFIGEESEALARAGEARGHVDHLNPGERRDQVSAELRHITQLLNDWVEFNEKGGEDFDHWCEEKGRHYNWINAYYYDK